jgi:hypothetical protein
VEEPPSTIFVDPDPEDAAPADAVAAADPPPPPEGGDAKDAMLEAANGAMMLRVVTNND